MSIPQREKQSKPLGHKAYGSIPHLPGSRLGRGDHHCEEGQARIATLQTRDKHDTVIVQEKLDGSNVCVARVGGGIQVLTRAGYHAIDSPYEQHHKFAYWVYDNIDRFEKLLKDGQRICGEWLLQAHGTLYQLRHEPFVAFDLFDGKERVTYHDFLPRIESCGFVAAHLLSYGPAYSIEDACKAIEVSHHGAIDPVEGAVWRVERKGKVDFMTKYVRHEKQDGKYLPENNPTGKPIYNTLPSINPNI